MLMQECEYVLVEENNARCWRLARRLFLPFRQNGNDLNVSYYAKLNLVNGCVYLTFHYDVINIPVHCYGQL